MEEREARRLLLWLVGVLIICGGDHSPSSIYLAYPLAERVVQVCMNFCT